MRYVALVHKDPGSAYGVTVPDVPGCFSAGETLDEALQNAVDAVLLHVEGGDLPAARDAEAIVADPSVRDLLKDAVLASVEVDPAEREFVPLDGLLLEAVDVAAGHRGISRADFVRRAVQAALAGR